jgi:hypothetical protein
MPKKTSRRFQTNVMIDRAEEGHLYCFFAPVLEKWASAPRVIPDAATFLARLNLRNRNF